MFFWIIAGIGAISGLWVIVRKLRENKQKKQKEQPASAKQKKQEEPWADEKLLQPVLQEPQKVQSSKEDPGSMVWEYSDGTLYVRGSGILQRCAEWKSFRTEPLHVMIEPGFSAIGKNAFRGFACVKVDIPDSVTEIGAEAFYDCLKLKDVVLPEGLHTIGQEAFCRCICACITLPESIRKIGWDAFKEVPDILYHGQPHIILTYDDDRWEALRKYESMHFEYVLGCRDKLFGSYIEPSGGLVDGYKPKLEYPEGVVITGCHWGETDVTVPAFLDGHPVVGIGRDAFAGLPVLRSVVIEAQILRIGVDAFFSCMDLESVRFPESLEMIDSEAFANTGLMELNLPSGLRKIGADAFRMTKIREAILPESLEILGDDAFIECEQLEKVFIPGSIECFVDAQQEAGWPMDQIYEQYGPSLDADGEPMSDTGSINTFAYCPLLTQVEDRYGLNRWQKDMLFMDTPWLASQNAETGCQ